MNKRRIVLDTNILISGIFWGGSPRALYELASEEKFVLLSSENLMAELHRVVHYPKFERSLNKRNTTPQQVIQRLRAMAQLVTPVEIPSDAVRDIDDVHVLACAVGGQADYIVSGDDDLLTLQAYENIPIVTVVSMLHLLRMDNN